MAKKKKKETKKRISRKAKALKKNESGRSKNSGKKQVKQGSKVGTGKKSVSAEAKYLNISPQKARLVADLVRGKEVDEALVTLEYTNKKAAGLIRKVLNSAIANAANNFEMEEDTLLLKRILVNKAPTLKRWRAGSRGRFKRILKRNCHIKIELEEK